MIAKNNIFNIRYSPRNHWIGQCGQNKGFCEFTDLKYGFRAGAKLLIRYIYVLDLWTVEKVIKRFAPPAENNTCAYISFVSKFLRDNGFNPDNLRTVYRLYDDDLFFCLCKAIVRMETSFILTKVDYVNWVTELNIRKELYG